MIGKSFAAAIAYLLAYQVFLNFTLPPGQQTLTFAEGNIVRAERYVHGGHDFPIVFVGSSLTEALEQFLTYDDSRCLGMVSMGPMEGLQLIESSRARPSLIMVEINRFSRQPRSDFLAGILQPQLYWLRDQLPCTQIEFQPMTLFIPWLDTYLHQFQWNAKGPSPAKPFPENRVLPPEPPCRRNADEISAEARACIEQLPTIHQRLDSLHLPYCLYHIPEHALAEAQPETGQLLEAVEAEFHQTVLVDRKHHYATRDGEHLADEDASAFAYFLYKEARRRVALSRGKFSAPKPATP